MRKILLVLMIFSLNILLVNAESCSEQLTRAKEAAEKVKINYEVLEEIKKEQVFDEIKQDFTDETYDRVVRKIKISVYNITKDIFIVRKERLRYKEAAGAVEEIDGIPVNYDEFGNQKIITYKDTKEGVFSFTTEDVWNYKDYTFDIYPDNDTSCDLSMIKTISFRQPKYNEYSEQPICLEYPTVELCKQFISYDFDLNGEDFSEVVLKRVKSGSSTNIITQKVEPNERDYNFFKDYWLYLAIGGAVIISGLIVYKIIDKKRSSI